MRKLIPAALLAVALPLTTAATLPPPPIPFCRIGAHLDRDKDKCLPPVPPRHHHHRHHRDNH